MAETTNKRPRAALINREWYLSARRVLPEDQLGRILIATVEYVLENVKYDKLNSDERIVFEMVLPWLDSDIESYSARCERNSRNAKRQSQRVAASGSEWQRVGANTTPTPTSTPTSTPTLSREVDEDAERKREYWLICGYFWSTGSQSHMEEATAFWSYYESLGWKNNKGAAIVSKIAAARMWRRQFGTQDPPRGADGWYRAASTSSIADPGLWRVFAGAEREEDGAVCRLRCTENYVRELLQACPGLLAILQRCWNVPAVRIERIDR